MDASHRQDKDPDRGSRRRTGNFRGGRGPSRGRALQRNNSAGRTANAIHTATPDVGTPPGLASYFVPSQDAPLSSSAPSSGWHQSQEYQGGNANTQHSARGRSRNTPIQGSSRHRPSNDQGADQASQPQDRSQGANGRHFNPRRNSAERGSSQPPMHRNNVVPIPSQYVSASPSGSYNTGANGTPHRGSYSNRSRYAELPQGNRSFNRTQQQTRYAEHLSQEELQAGLKTMQLFKGAIRVNAGDNSQAYLSLPGLSADIFIKGLQSQNRSVEGDEVAIRVGAPNTWWTFKREQQMAQLKAAGRSAEEQENGHGRLMGASPGLMGASPGLIGASPNAAAAANTDGHDLATPSESGLEKAYSGGEMPYHLSDVASGAANSSRAMNKRHNHPALPPIDDESVFDPMTDFDASEAIMGQGPSQEQAKEDHGNSQADGDEEAAQESEEAQGSDSQQYGSCASDDANLAAAESASDSWRPDQSPGPSASPQQSGDYSWSQDLVSRLNLNPEAGTAASPSGGVPSTPNPTPSSVPAIGSAPSSTLSEFSAVGRDIGNRPSLGKSKRPERHAQKRSYSNNNRRSSLNQRDNGAAKECSWQGAESLDAAVAVLNDLMSANPGIRPTAEVVAVLTKSARRSQVVGILRQEGPRDTLALTPCDPRMPQMMVPVDSLPEDLKLSLLAEARDKSLTSRTLVSALMLDWAAGSSYPIAHVRSSLGQAGELEAETEALLQMEAVSSADFAPEVLACLPQALPWEISPKERAVRRDFTNTRLFSIDPPTARDLDDALSIEELPDGNFRVGVHIADVAHFIRPGSALDKEAQARGTSVYLVQRVIPMLPRLLCEQLCSLNPGVERLAFSVTWDLTPGGQILSQWAGRSIIKSCVKLAYGHAQEMIEGSFAGLPNQAAPAVELHDCDWSEVVHDVLALNSIARQLRAGRVANGALRLDNTKLYFSMDDNGNPVSAAPYVQREANQLVEEFMLLANMSVARMVARAFPERALLRRHPPPNERKIQDLSTLADELGIEVDVSSAGTLARSLQALRTAVADPAVMEAVQLLATKPMQTAKYFSTGDFEDQDKWQHYALAVPHYTHFTSPIRRYPDVLVHRLLAAALHLNPALADQSADRSKPGSRREQLDPHGAADSAPEPHGAAESALEPLQEGGSQAGDQRGESQRGSESQHGVESQQRDESQQGMELLQQLQFEEAGQGHQPSALQPDQNGQPSGLLRRGTQKALHDSEGQVFAQQLRQNAAEQLQRQDSTGAQSGTQGVSKGDEQAQRQDSTGAQSGTQGVLGGGEQAQHRDSTLTGGLLDGEELSAVAQHCNERKQAAKNVQDGSLKLYLCVLLRQHPLVTEAVCLQLGGNKFIDVYIAELGTDCRIHVEHMLPSVSADFHKETKQLTLSQNALGSRSWPRRNGTGPAVQSAQTLQVVDGWATGGDQQDPHSAADNTAAGASTGAAGSNSAGQLEDQASLVSQPCLRGVEFLENLRNPKNLQPHPLPVQLKLFSRIPVVISARLFGQTGKPSEVYARLLIS